MTVSLTQRLCVSALVVTCEGIAASGKLSEREEMQLRRVIAETRCAFGADIPQRELPGNVVEIGGYLR